jgi:ElaB/YqjD/DUF883 family membrane-anchored ribosome-binding protein
MTPEERQTAGASKSGAAETRGEYENAQNVWDDARRGPRTLKQNAEQYVRGKPITSILFALAAGFVAGLMMFRH